MFNKEKCRKAAHQYISVLAVIDDLKNREEELNEEESRALASVRMIRDRLCITMLSSLLIMTWISWGLTRINVDPWVFIPIGLLLMMMEMARIGKKGKASFGKDWYGYYRKKIKEDRN